MGDENKWGNLGLGLAGQVGGGIIGAGMGMLMEGHNDRRQLEQEEKLQAIQMKNAKQMADYNQGLAMQMWKDTNYPAQMEMLKKAGLNPGLLYGKGGPGGSTAGAGVAGMPSSGGAPKGGGEGLGMMMAGQQAALIAAQTENIKADTEKKKAEVPNIEASTLSLTQGVENQKAVEKLTGVQTSLAEIEMEIKGSTMKAAKYLITGEADRLVQEVNIMRNEGLISENTWSEKIDIIRAELIGIQLNNVLTGAKTFNINQNTKLQKAQTATEGERRYLTKEQARSIGHSIMMGWEGLSNEQKRQRLQENLQNYSMNEGAALDIMEQAVDGIMRAGGSNVGDKRTWETGENPDGSRWSREKYEKTGR